MENLAHILRDVLQKLDSTLGQLPYNLYRYKTDHSCGHEKTTGKRSRQTSIGTWRFCLKLLRSPGSSGHRAFSITLYRQRLQLGALHRAERLEAFPGANKENL